MKNLEPEIFPVMLTPYNLDNSIDFGGLRQLTDFYLATGSSGLFANCLSSEMFELSEEERIQITETVVKQVNGRQKVIATGTFSLDQKQNSEFIKQIYNTGVDAVIINSNRLANQNETDDVWKKNMEFILNETGNITLGIYECPVPYKRLISSELLKWAVDTGRFEFLKETSCDTNIIRAKLDATLNSSLKIYNANIPTLVETIQAGARGVASIASNFYPELVHFLVKNANLNDEKLQKINEMLTVMDPLIHDCYPLSAKYFLQKRGMKINTITRKKNVAFSYQDYLKFDKLLGVFERISEELEIEIIRFN